MRKDAFPINSTTKPPGDVLLVDQDVPLAQPSTTVLLARTLLSLPEEEFAQTAPTPVLLVMELELVPHASVDSTTSKVPARNLVLLEPTQSTESANADQELFLLVSA